MDQEYDLQLQVTRSKINQKSQVPRFAFQNNQQNFDESLKYLSLQQTRITQLPEGMQKLKKLISLNLNDNYIKLLDYNILDGLKNLEILFIRNNLLQEFQFGRFKHLQQLDISQNHIKKISNEIGDLLQLDQLFISHNSYMEIPRSITKLKYTLNVFQLDWFKYGDPGVQELFQSQDLIYQLLHTIELCCTGETISAKQLLSSIAYKQFALKYQDKDIQIQYKIHQTILDEDIGMLRTLLSEPKKFQIDEINQDDYSPLGLSIWEEKYLAARYLLYANADPNKGASWARSCLNIAVSKLQYYLVFDLIKRNVGLHELDIYGNNSIHYLFCVYQMNEVEAQKIMQLLLKNGVNGNHINNNGQTPIHLAVSKGYIQVIEYIYKQKEYKFNFRQKTQRQKQNCLHLAVLTRQIYIVKFFIYKFPEFIFQKDYHDLIPIDYLKNDLTIYKYLKGFQKVEIQHILTKNEIFYQSQLSDECDDILSIKVQSLAQLDNLGLENKIQTTRINEITRQIPLSPNNLKRLEEKNTLMNPKDSQRIQCQIYKGIKKIAYEFDRLQYNNIENLLNQDQFQEQVDDLIQIKKLLYQLNCIKNIIDSNDIYSKQWHFQLKSLKYQINKHVYSERNLEDQKKVSNQLLQIFLEIIKKVEQLYNKKEKIDSQLQDFIITQFLSIHSGFGLDSQGIKFRCESLGATLYQTLIKKSIGKIQYFQSKIINEYIYYLIYMYLNWICILYIYKNNYTKMLIFLTLSIANSIQLYEILIGYPQIIEYYQTAGIIIEQNLTSTSEINLTPSPCQVVPQQLINQNLLQQSLPIIPQYLVEQFSQFFNDGHFLGLIPHIISFVNIDNDVVILTNLAELIYIRFLNETFIVSDKINLNINLTILQNPVFMETINNQLIIIMYSETVGITLNVKAEKIFSKSFRIYESFNTNKIMSKAVVNNMLFIAMGVGGLKIFQLNGQILSSIDFEYQINNATDLKVFHQFDVYFIYLLDYDLGVTPFIYNPKSTLIYKNERLGIIPFSGDIIDIYNNIMMIASYQDQQTIIQEIQLNYTDFSWKQINKHIINSLIVDIDILDHIAITLGQNGNTVIFHSIPSTFQIKQQHFIMPSLLKLNYIKSQGSLYLLGVSLHNFYFSKLELKQSYLYCYFEHEQQIKLNYSHISECKKQENGICTYNQEYIIQSIKPIITTEQNFLIYLTLFFVALVFIIMVVLLIKEFKKYNQFVHNLDLNGQKQNEITIQTFESPTKIIKFNQTGTHTSQFSIISNISRVQQV